MSYFVTYGVMRRTLLDRDSGDVLRYIGSENIFSVT